MAWGVAAVFAIILVILSLVILFLTFGPGLYMVCPILVGMIALAFGSRRSSAEFGSRRSSAEFGSSGSSAVHAKTSNPSILPISDRSHGNGAPQGPPPRGAPTPSGPPPVGSPPRGAPTPPGPPPVGSPPGGALPLPSDASPPADGAPPPPGDASAPAGSALPPAGTPPPGMPLPPPAGAPPPPGDASAPAVDASARAGGSLPPAGTPPQVGALPPPGDASLPGVDASAPAGGAQPPAGDASALAVDASALAVDASATAGGAPPPPGDASAPVGGALRPVGAEKRQEPESTEFKYDVFLNFRGSDTRSFMDYLYRRLVDAGIRVFRDDEELRVGDDLGSNLLKVIKGSRISIAIISKDYASSVWCLNELKLMWECKKSNGQIIIPIFYGVSSNEVRYQTGYIGEAFVAHEKKLRHDPNTINTWRKVLQEITGLPGGYSGNLYEGYLGQLVEEVVLRIAQTLRDDGLAVTDKPVGIDFHVEEMMSKLGVSHSEGQQPRVHGEDERVRVVGICGVPGVGKTTLAKIVYNKMCHMFHARSFLPEVSSKGVQFSQQMLLADLQRKPPEVLNSIADGIKKIATLFVDSKVLIVLDDVDENEQIEALVGNLTWFGPGSRIIVTTNKRKVLSAFDVGAVQVHEVVPRSDDDACFRADAPEDVSEYDFLSMEPENSGRSEPENSIEDN